MKPHRSDWSRWWPFDDSWELIVALMNRWMKNIMVTCPSTESKESHVGERTLILLYLGVECVHCAFCSHESQWWSKCEARGDGIYGIDRMREDVRLMFTNENPLLISGNRTMDFRYIIHSTISEWRSEDSLWLNELICNQCFMLSGGLI